MNNFPHQINNLSKIVKAVQIFKELIEAGEDVTDDEVFGDKLAYSRVYTFRYPPQTDDELRVRVELEKNKPAQDQGARTCARDLRKLFKYFQFIDSSCNLTSYGEYAINVGADLADSSVCSFWKVILRSVSIESKNGQMHPYIAMLKLAREIPGISKERLALALEPYDDSNDEFQRILHIANNANWREQVSSTLNQLRNAIKILPALAVQVGDIYQRNDQCFLSDNNYLAEYEITNQLQRGTAVRSVTADSIAAIPTKSDFETDYTEEMLRDKIANAIQKTLDRTKRHQMLVKRISRSMQNAGFSLFENPMDCYCVRDTNSEFLFEIKTLDVDNSDEKKQVRLAIGQLLYYSYNYRDKNLNKVAVFERRISDEHIALLEHFNCLVLWKERDEIVGSNRTMNVFGAKDVIL